MAPTGAHCATVSVRRVSSRDFPLAEGEQRIFRHRCAPVAKADSNRDHADDLLSAPVAPIVSSTFRQNVNHPSLARPFPRGID